MAQVMVNFRMDEDVKKSMEQACREMGLSMTAAFTIFARKVGKEKRIPFEITAEPCQPEPCRRQGGRGGMEEGPEDPDELVQRQERTQRLCTAIRRSLTAIHTAIPASITGLSMERIRLLCGDELKDKAAGVSGASRSLFSRRNAGVLRGKDWSLFDEYLDALSAISRELLDIEGTLIPAMKAWRGGDGGDFAPCEQKLSAISQEFDALSPLMQRFLYSTASTGGARAARARIRQAARQVETPYVLTALENLETLIFQNYDLLEEKTRERLEADYLQTLELTLWELGQAEREGGDAAGKAALCLRVINVLSRMISDSRRARQEWSGRRLEAEVEALERLAAMRGEIAGAIHPES